MNKRYLKFIGIILALSLTLPTIALSSCKNDERSESVTLPVISINTYDGSDIQNRNVYKDMTLTVSGAANDKYNISLEGEIKGRGNSTWDFCDKKSYRIKLSEKSDLLGCGSSDRDWILLANAREKSLLRNWAVFSLAKRMGMPYVTESTFVTLILNSEYMGVYQLCEKVEAGKHRVPIDEEWRDGDCGFLLELDRRAKNGATPPTEYFSLEGVENPISIKSDVVSKEQNAYIKSLVDDFTRLCESGDLAALGEIADIDSIVDMYILEDFAHDRDVGYASFFFYRERGGKITFGAPWDFDLALGNDTGEDQGENFADAKGSVNHLNPWFARLEESGEFMALVAARFASLDDEFASLRADTLDMGYKLEEEAKKNYDKWKVMGRKQLFEPFAVWIRTNYISQVKYLCSWMEKRCDYLSERYGEYLSSNETKGRS